jgi:hypothetical protein
MIKTYEIANKYMSANITRYITYQTDVHILKLSTPIRIYYSAPNLLARKFTIPTIANSC